MPIRNIEGDVDLYFAILREFYAVVTKRVVESDRENCEYLPGYCDKLARQFGGHIQGIIKEGDCAKIHLIVNYVNAKFLGCH